MNQAQDIEMSGSLHKNSENYIKQSFYIYQGPIDRAPFPQESSVQVRPYRFNGSEAELLDAFKASTNDNGRPMISYQEVVKEISSNTKTTSNYEERMIDPSDSKEFLSLLMEDELEIGMVSEAEDYLCDLMELKTKDYGMKLVSTIYQEYADNASVMAKLMHILSHFSYKDVSPYGSLIGMAALTQRDPIVREMALRAYDRWNDKVLLPSLRSYEPSSFLMKRIVDRLIEKIEKPGD